MTEGVRKVTRVTRQVQILAGGVCGLGYHVVWYVKYRPPVRAGQIAAVSEELIRARANGRGWRMMALEIMPRHMHLLVNTHPSHFSSRVANQLRGFVPRRLCAEFAHLHSRLTLWSWPDIAAAGAVSVETVGRYSGTPNGRPRRKERSR